MIHRRRGEGGNKEEPEIICGCVCIFNVRMDVKNNLEALYTQYCYIRCCDYGFEITA